MALGAGLPGVLVVARPALVRRLLAQAPLDADAAGRRRSGGASRSLCATASSSRSRPSRTCSRRSARRTSPSGPAARGRHDPLGEVLIEVNALADTLRAQRMGALDASGLLGAVMEEIPVAVFAFDPERRLRLVNRAGERLLARPSERVIGLDADALGLATALEHEHSPTIAATFPGGVRPVGGSQQGVPAGRAAARTARAHGREPVAARRGAPGLAAAHPRHRPRDQQLARADQVDRAQPRAPAHARAAGRRLGEPTCAAASP